MLGRSGEVVLPSPKAEPAVSPGSPLPPGLQTPSRPPNGELACPAPSCNFSPWLCLAEVIPCWPWMGLPGSRSRSHPLHFVHALRISQPARRQGSCAHSESCHRAEPAVRVELPRNDGSAVNPSETWPQCLKIPQSPPPSQSGALGISQPARLSLCRGAVCIRNLATAWSLRELPLKAGSATAKGQIWPQCPHADPVQGHPPCSRGRDSRGEASPRENHNSSQTGGRPSGPYNVARMPT